MEALNSFSRPAEPLCKKSFIGSRLVDLDLNNNKEIDLIFSNNNSTKSCIRVKSIGKLHVRVPELLLDELLINITYEIIGTKIKKVIFHLNSSNNLEISSDEILVFDMGNLGALISCMKSYKWFPKMRYEILDYVKSSSLELDRMLYRGDCLLPRNYKVGDKIRFHGLISSWTTDQRVAEKFSSNVECPAWFTTKKNWYLDDDYPFEGLSKEDLIPVIFMLDCYKTIGINLKDILGEYEKEEEYILSNRDFLIEEINGKYIKLREEF